MRSVKNDIKLYRQENIPLFTELTNKAQKFGEISAQMMVTIDGKEKTLQQASVYLKNTDRAKRKEAFDYLLKISKKRRIKTLTGPDYYLTKFINFFI